MMKRLKKLTALLTAIGMVAAMSACGSDAASSAAASSAGTEAAPAATEAAAPAEAGSAADGDTYLIGICQLVQHEALDAATQGFKDALTEKLGDKVKFDEQNASGDSANCSTIVNGFLSESVDLILANAHRSAPGCCRCHFRRSPYWAPPSPTTPPHWRSATWTGTVGNNVSGTSDLAPLDQQAAMIKELFPDAKNVGLLYCSAEPNSRLSGATPSRATWRTMGYHLHRSTPSPTTNDVASVTQTACDRLRRASTSPPTTLLPPTPRPLPTWFCLPACPSVAGEEGIC